MSKKGNELFDYFDAVNEGNFSHVDNMSEEDAKKVQPFVLLSWMHGASSNNAEHTILTDLYCNRAVFSLSSHRRLLLKKFIEANSEMGDTRYRFIRPTTKKSDKNIKAVSEYYAVGLKEAADYVTILSEDDIEYINHIIDSSK